LLTRRSKPRKGGARGSSRLLFSACSVRDGDNIHHIEKTETLTIRSADMSEERTRLSHTTSPPLVPVVQTVQHSFVSETISCLGKETVVWVLHVPLAARIDINLCLVCRVRIDAEKSTITPGRQSYSPGVLEITPRSELWSRQSSTSNTCSLACSCIGRTRAGAKKQNEALDAEWSTLSRRVVIVAEPEDAPSRSTAAAPVSVADGEIGVFRGLVPPHADSH